MLRLTNVQVSLGSHAHILILTLTFSNLTFSRFSPSYALSLAGSWT